MLTWALLLLVIGLLLFVAEVFVPSYGVLSVLACVSLLAGVIMLFTVNRWAGALTLLTLAAGAPFAFSAAMHLWQKTPMGKQMILTKTAGDLPRNIILVGSTGAALTDLRPMGEIELNDVRVQAITENNVMIAAGTNVKVLAMTDTIATVRPLTQLNSGV